MPNQYFATNRKVGDGSTTVWEFSFAGARPDANNGTEPYLEPQDVGVALVSYDAEGREERTPVSFTLLGPSQVEVIPAIADGQDFVIFRETEDALPVTDFTDFASISEQDLDNAIRQTLFVVQEARDDLNDGNENAATARGIANSAAAEAASATATANSATATANTALSTANSASSVAAGAASTANSAAADVSTALSIANQALSGAGGAALAVQGAINTADAAQLAASGAVSTANTANSTASSANSTANAALNTANTAASDASTALAAANAAVLTANAADAKADEALSEATQAQADASLVVGFQQQLDSISAAVNDLTGVEPGAISLNSDNLSKLTDFAEARANLDVYSTGEVNALVDSSGRLLEPRVVAVEDAVGTLQTDVGALQADVSEAQSGISGLQDSKADKSLILTAGNGLSGGGDLSVNRSFAVDATVVRTSRSVSAGNGLLGGGALSANRTISLGTPSTLDGSTTNSVTAVSHTHAISSTTARNNPSTSILLAAAAMNDHRTSSDHDARYTLKSETSSISSQVQELDSRLGGFGSAAPSIANSYIQVGARGRFEGSESAAVSAGFPALGGSSEPRHWSIDSFGSESPARGVQMAVEVFGVGTARGRTFIRVRHDATWHPWKELGAGESSSSAGAVGTYAFLYSPGSNSFGSTEAGANLQPSDVATNTTARVSGTWRCMGSGTGANRTVWLRIA